MSAQQDMFLSMTDEEAEEAEDAEFFRTPRDMTLQLLNTASALPPDGENGFPDGLCVDAGAGDGGIWSVIRHMRILSVVAPVEIRRQGIRDGKRHGPERVVGPFVSDWLYPSSKVLKAIKPAAVVVMNSAFSITHEFVKHAFRHCPDAWVWSLQRQSWGKPAGDRAAWLVNHWPEYKLQCMGSRPSFTGDGKTDGAEYIWYGWSPTGRNRKYARFEGPCHEHPQPGLMATETT